VGIYPLGILKNKKVMKRKRSTGSRHTTPAKKTRILQNINQPPAYVARNAIDEAKIMDVAAVNQSLFSAGSMFNLYTGIARGTSSLGQFIGNKLNPTGIDLRVTFHFSPVPGADDFNLCRCILFQWFLAGVPLPADILQTTSILSPIQWTNKDNIKVLSDRTEIVESNLGTDRLAHTYRVYIKGKNIRQTEFPSAGIIPQRGGLYCLVYSDSTVIPDPLLDIYTRVTYHDS